VTSGAGNRGRVLGGTALVLLTLLLGACASVPTSGPVVEGRPAGEPVPLPNVAVLPSPPRPGDQPVAIAEGFLTAMSSYEPGYPTAREFLTPQAAASWDPEAAVTVYSVPEGARRVTELDGAVQAVLPLVATVAADGSYEPAPLSSTLALDLQMQQVDGEWRIATPPTGTVMSSFDFTREFSAFSSYFYAPTGDVLVPDITYLPVRGNLPTLLVDEVLDGPTDWLAPAVSSAVGPGVQLASGAVTLAGTTAQVDLTGQVVAATAQQRDRIAAQLAWTLRQAPGVTDLALLADGQPLPLPSSDTGVVSVEAYEFLDPSAVPAGERLFAVADGGVVSVDDDVVRPVSGPLGEPGRFRSVGVSFTGTQGAAVRSDGTGLVRARLSQAADTATTVDGQDLSEPSFDRQDRTWVVDRADDASSVLVLAQGDDVPTQVPAPELEGTRVERLSVAADGVRAAVVYRSGGTARLALALVLVGADGQSSVSGLRDLPIEGLPPQDASWASATALAVLAGDVGEAQPYVVELSDGALSSRGQLGGATALAASAAQPLVVGTTDGQLLRQDALLEWEPVAQASAPTYPG
jgi:hypothetical protein